jgi:hypothetical protein
MPKNYSPAPTPWEIGVATAMQKMEAVSGGATTPLEITYFSFPIPEKSESCRLNIATKGFISMDLDIRLVNRR